MQMYLYKNSVVKGMHHYFKRVEWLYKYLPAFDVVNKLAIYGENEWYFHLN